ncbi:hypothetical protein HNO88_001431 [Novosphingobium chloroacetimidivorans]|uniref:Uncharacterized protein n=1 Tax=Novosphingobium chloroacetimidivorans TaxID=1428314 RepID=A0A7W7K8C5_9SPHN|nr:nuclear transport factor 2 family protein [Novosphingobium chloroacetimidivorans]MBB4858117.1 hypothetical protein [Novosphingobium chloroacetimidivorans]
MTFTGRIEDWFAIRELYGTYADASWRGEAWRWRGVAMARRGDGEQWLGCFTPDGRWTSHLFDASGHAALRATWDGLWQDWQSVAFLGEIGSMESDGDRRRGGAVPLLRMGNHAPEIGRHLQAGGPLRRRSGEA